MFLYNGAVPILMDPSMLITKRCQDWLDRQSHQAPGVQVLVPRALIADGGRETLEAYRGIGPWALRPTLIACAAALEEVDAARGDRFAQYLASQGPAERVLGDLWTGLRNGSLLLARRLTTFEGFTAAGAVLVVRALKESDAWSQTRASMPAPIFAALERRTRVVARACPCNETDQPCIEVFDAGPYGRGGWH